MAPKAKKNKFPNIHSLIDLRYKCNNGDEESQKYYQQLALISAKNLGAEQNCSLDQAFDWLNINAMETDEDGVVGEINFCKDFVK